MNASGFRKLLERVGALNKRQRQHLLEVLRPAVGLDRLRDTIEGTKPVPPSCPACHGQRSNGMCSW